MRARALVVGVALLVALAGCAGESTPTATPAPTPAVSDTPVLGGELTVFAAASLQGAFDDLLAEFSDQNPGVTVHPPTYDSSSALATELAAGAPADIFAAADESDMTTATDAGRVVGEPTVFATDELEIVVPAGNPNNIRSLHDLGVLSDSGGKVVICAAAEPCGSAAHKVLDTSGVGVTPASNEPDDQAVLAKVQSGQADAGLVYRTTVQGAGGTVEGVAFPESSAAVRSYPIAVLTGPTTGAGGPEVAQAFVDLVMGPGGRAILAARGLVVP